MKKRITRFLGQCLKTVAEAPVETALCLYLFVISALWAEDVLTKETYHGWLVPVFFSLAYICNRLFPRNPRRIIYYLCGLGILPFWGTDTHQWLETPGYYVSLIICLLAVPASLRLRDNVRLISRLLRYVADAASALLLSGAAWLMVLAIYFSVVYIFNIFKGASSDVLTYSSMTFFMLIAPLIFLTLDREETGKDPLPASRLFSTLINYILTPALLIYTGILYLYFAVITVTWSLPKGGIAYMVFIFTIVAVLVKALLPLADHRFCGWYYKRFSYISLPALVMFWIGVLYRVSQYGYTESRVYLVVCGGIMTLAVLLFLFRRTAHYQYIINLSILALALFTYIPGLTARAISVRSQTARAEQMIRKLELTGKDGLLLREKRPDSDSVYKEDYYKLYESAAYLDRTLSTEEFTKKYGIESVYELRSKIIPDCLQWYVIDPAGDTNENYRESEDTSVLLVRENALDIAGYSTLYEVPAYKQESLPYYYDYSSTDTLYIKGDGDEIRFKIYAGDLLSAQLRGTGYTPGGPVPADSLRSMTDRLLEYETDTLKLIFNHSTLERTPELKYTNIGVSYLLVK